jgi:hypothetical protein
MKLPAASCGVFWRRRINQDIPKRLGVMPGQILAPKFDIDFTMGYDKKIG